MRKVLGIVGLSGSGKTTLICGLIRLLDMTIGVIKRTHHERPGLGGGKDTDRYLEAGADHSVLVTPLAVHRFSVDGHLELPLEPIDRVVSRAAESADLVIIESAMYDGDWPRLLVHAAGRELPAPFPPLVEGIVTNEKTPIAEDIRQFDRDDLPAVARFVIRISS